VGPAIAILNGAVIISGFTITDCKTHPEVLNIIDKLPSLGSTCGRLVPRYGSVINYWNGSIEVFQQLNEFYDFMDYPNGIGNGNGNRNGNAFEQLEQLEQISHRFLDSEVGSRLLYESSFVDSSNTRATYSNEETKVTEEFLEYLDEQSEHKPSSAGGIYITGNSSVTIRECNITSNDGIVLGVTTNPDYPAEVLVANSFFTINHFSISSMVVAYQTNIQVRLVAIGAFN
jgi:hypothetical protein